MARAVGIFSHLHFRAPTYSKFQDLLSPAIRVHDDLLTKLYKEAQRGELIRRSHINIGWVPYSLTCTASSLADCSATGLLSNICVTASAFVGAILAPTLAPPILGIVGFGLAGPVAGKPLHTSPPVTGLNANVGSMAAGIQAGLGNVVSGSLFATAQSVAMGGVTTCRRLPHRGIPCWVCCVSSQQDDHTEGATIHVQPLAFGSLWMASMTGLDAVGRFRG